MLARARDRARGRDRSELEARREPERLALEARRQAARRGRAGARRGRGACWPTASRRARRARSSASRRSRATSRRPAADVFAVLNAMTALRHAHGARRGAARARRRDARQARRRSSDDLRREVEKVEAERAAAADALRRAQDGARRARKVARAARESELADRAHRARMARARRARRASRSWPAIEARLRSLEELASSRAEFGDAARMVLVQANGHVGQLGAVADYLEVEPLRARGRGVPRRPAPARARRAARAGGRGPVAGPRARRRPLRLRRGRSGLERLPPARGAARCRASCRCRDVAARSSGPHAAHDSEGRCPRPTSPRRFEQAVALSRADVRAGRDARRRRVPRAAPGDRAAPRPSRAAFSRPSARSRNCASGSRVERDGARAPDRRGGAASSRRSRRRPAAIAGAARPSSTGRKRRSSASRRSSTRGRRGRAAAGAQGELIALETPSRRGRARRRSMRGRPRRSESIARLEDEQRRGRASGWPRRSGSSGDARDDGRRAEPTGPREARAAHAGLSSAAPALAGRSRRGSKRPRASSSSASQRVHARASSRCATGASALLAGRSPKASGRSTRTSARSRRLREDAARAPTKRPPRMRAQVDAQEAVIREARRVARRRFAREAGELDVARATAESDLTHLAQPCVDAVQMHARRGARARWSRWKQAGEATPDAARHRAPRSRIPRPTRPSRVGDRRCEPAPCRAESGRDRCRRR